MAVTFSDLDKTMRDFISPRAYDDLFKTSPLLARLRSSKPMPADPPLQNPIGYSSGTTGTMSIREPLNYDTSIGIASTDAQAGEFVEIQMNGIRVVEDQYMPDGVIAIVGGSYTAGQGINLYPSNTTGTVTVAGAGQSIVKVIDQRIADAANAMSAQLAQDMAGFYTQPRTLKRLTADDFEAPVEALSPLEPIEYGRQITLAD